MAVADDLDLGRYKLGWSDAEDYVFKPKKGLTQDIVREMSWMKGEPDWMLTERLKSLKAFEKRPMPRWGGDMSEIYFDDIYYYIKPTEKQVDAWDDLPDSVKQTYEKFITNRTNDVVADKQLAGPQGGFGTPTVFVNGERYQGGFTNAEQFAAFVAAAVKDAGSSGSVTFPTPTPSK